MKLKVKNLEFYLLYVYHENTKKKFINKVESHSLNARSPCVLLQHMSYAFESQEVKTKSNGYLGNHQFHIIILIGLIPTMSSRMDFTNTA